MANTNDPAAKPKDATKVTEEQREQQDLLEHRGDDPQAPGRHQTHHEVPDESNR